MSDHDDTCSICFDTMNEKNDLLTLKCNHSFHVRCITDWLIGENNCPICRKEHKERIDTIDELNPLFNILKLNKIIFYTILMLHTYIVVMDYQLLFVCLNFIIMKRRRDFDDANRVDLDIKRYQSKSVWIVILLMIEFLCYYYEFPFCIYIIQCCVSWIGFFIF